MFRLSPIARDLYLDLCSLPPEVPAGNAFASVFLRLERLTEVLSEEAATVGLELFEHPYLVGPGAALADLLRALSYEVADDERIAAASELDGKIQGLLADPDAQRAFCRLAEERDQSPTDLRQELLLEGLLLAAAYGERPQRIRLGTRYVKAEDGSVAETVPDDLTVPFDLQVAWLIKEARNAIEAILLDRSYPTSPNENVAGGSVSSEAHSAEERDHDESGWPEDTTDPIEALTVLRSVASRREREYLELLAEDHAMTNKEAARRLGVRPGTVSAMKARLKDKGKRASAGPL